VIGLSKRTTQMSGEGKGNCKGKLIQYQRQQTTQTTRQSNTEQRKAEHKQNRAKQSTSVTHNSNSSSNNADVANAGAMVN